MLLLLLVETVWLDELLLLEDSVDADDWLDIDWLDLLLIDDCGDELLELLLLDDRLEEDSVLVEEDERLDRLLLLVLADEVLDVESELVEEVLSDDVLRDDADDSVLLDSELVVRLDVLSDDVLDDDSSSTPMIRSSCCDGPRCCGPLVTIRSNSSLVGKSKIAGAFSTPPIVSRNSARHCMLSARVIVRISSVFSSACVVKWSEYTPLTAAKIFNCRDPRWVPPFPR